MNSYQSIILREMDKRGFIYQGTNLLGLDDYISNNDKISAYVGFDATANSLHVGNLLQIMRIRYWQKMGLKPIILVGGGTTKIGDPSGKNSARQMLTQEEISLNIEGQMKVLRKYIKFGDGQSDAILVNNDDWLSKIGFLDMLRIVGSHFSVNKMITFDIVKNRLDQQNNISFLEFNYMVLQAYDFYHLHNKFGCVLQMGGADQWANIICGVDLVRRLLKTEVFGLTSSLITKANGEKMGKTAKGALWLDENMLSPFDYWQFWRNCDDGDIKKFLLLFTDLSIEKIETLPFSDNINECKIILANEATKITHGEEEAKRASCAAKSISSGFVTSGIPEILMEDSVDMGILNLLILSDLCKSRGEAKRLIQGGGASLNGKSISKIDYVCDESDIDENHGLTLSFGKKRHIRLIFSKLDIDTSDASI